MEPTRFVPVVKGVKRPLLLSPDDVQSSDGLNDAMEKLQQSPEVPLCLKVLLTEIAHRLGMVMEENSVESYPVAIYRLETRSQKSISSPVLPGTWSVPKGIAHLIREELKERATIFELGRAHYSQLLGTASLCAACREAERNQCTGPRK
ncbi:unnamed protein product [Nippostrongylus brasiliensis]|uniref:AMMECR1 domain-containing protein n=1 Tax=Nippostrongylus brasiliensis TaxID=27835 RepID=A0A0N4YI97_NIPBR|nr:unnamed protein product [Nippostrongylus brasiliensis]